MLALSTSSIALDCSALFTRQLDELATLVKRLRTPRRDADAGRLLRELTNRAVLHVLSRERLLLPAWRQVGWKDLPFDAMAAHFAFKHALAELLVVPPGSVGFQEALTAFAAALEQQRTLDRGSLIPGLRSAMDLHQRRALCNDIELFFDAGSPPSGDPLGAPNSLQELIDEAEVVLSSLSANMKGGGQAAPA